MSRLRLGLLAAANAAALLLLVGVLLRPGPTRADGGGPARAPAIEGAALQAPAASPGPAPARESAPRAPQAPALAERIRARIAAARSAAAGRGVERGAVRVAVHVRERGRPGELVAIEADHPLRPASNMKLLTSAAALVLLGPDWSFRTRFESAAALVDGVLRGDLVARAGGDPLYDPAAGGEVAHLLRPLVADLCAAGLRRVEGDLVLDEEGWLEAGPGPAWPPQSQHWSESCARCAGFSANAGCLTALVEPGEVGGPARVRVLPASHGLVRDGSVTTGAPRSRLVIAVAALPPAVTVRGSIPADVALWETRFAHPDPVELFGAALRAALAEGGIELAGGLVRARGRPAGRLLAELRSPLIGLLGAINTDSNNAVADQVFLATGRAVAGRGERAAGGEATGRALARLGLDPAGLVQVDGSGLSRDDRVSARQTTALIDAVLALDDATAEAFRGSLAVAGETGTLAGRMTAGPARGRVRAKTGWISGTSALSGVARTLDGRELVFSILVDYPPQAGLNTSCWKPMSDAICELLVEHDG